MTNTTSLVGYIAVLMFVGAYLGGDQNYALDPILLKGSVLESRGMPSHISTKSVTITIDGRQYEATIHGESGGKKQFTY
jgi:hypothetical protein